MARFCTECGAPIKGDSKYCMYCGKPILQSSERPHDPEPQMDGSQTYGQSSQQSTQQTYQQTSQQTSQQPYQQTNQQPYQQPSASMPQTPKPDNYLALSIITTILCCWPLGIPAIVNASKVDRFWREGDFVSAQNASQKARRWSLYSVIGGIIVIIIMVLAALMEDY